MRTYEVIHEHCVAWQLARSWFSGHSSLGEAVGCCSKTAGTGVCKLRVSGQTQHAAWVVYGKGAKIACTFLKRVCKKIKKKKKKNMRWGPLWPSKPKRILFWPFTE